MMFIVLLYAFLPTILGHSWMTCPPSFVTSLGRGGFQNVQCETDGASAHITEVWAGDRLKVGWTSNNHAGGYVRLSLVKFGDHTGASAPNNFLKNVLKFVCYGHERAKGPNNGDCIHPCDGRPGCEYQSDQYDVERFDTTIKIPTNLDGIYVLQAALLVGNSQSPYYSCAKLRITKGNTQLNCQSNEAPLTYSCLKTGGPALETHFLKINSKRGNFCYKFDGSIGGIDDDLRAAPINVECDPRLTCDNSVRADFCLRDYPSMGNIVNGNQPGCSALYTIPPPPPSCNDDILNRDETGIDCGGSFCTPCPTTVLPVISGLYYSSITQEDSHFFGDGNSATFNVKIAITKDVSNANQCWQVVLQYQHPINIGSSWGNGNLVHSNDQKTIFIFERYPYTPDLKAGSTITISFSATNPIFGVESGQVVWTAETTRLQRASQLAVYDDKTECFTQFQDEEI